jgi:hypothetical protein
MATHAPRTPKRLYDQREALLNTHRRIPQERFTITPAMGTLSFEKEKERAIAAALEAGAIIRSIYNTNYTVDYKGKDSPVTS